MLKFEFLGVNGSLQDHNSGNTSLLVFGKEGSIAIDLSCNMAAVTDAAVDAVILTHEHIDHVYALPSLLHQLWLTGRTKALSVYVPKGMERLAGGLLDLFGIREKKNMFEIVLCTDSAFAVGTMHITTFPTDHTDMSVGMVIEDGKDKLVYTGDTRPMSEVLPCMNGAQILIHEASGPWEDEESLIKKGHSSGADAGMLSLKLNVNRLYLCHLPRGESAKAQILGEAKRIFPETYIAEICKAEACL